MDAKTNLLRRYIWLLDILQNQRLTFKQISRKWEMSYEFNEEHAPLPLRTFHNHRREIFNIFGITIENEGMGDYAYYIKEYDDDYQSSMQKSIVNSLILVNSPRLRERVLIDKRSEDLFFSPLYKAIQEEKKIYVVYRRKDRGINNIHKFTIEPYYLKSFSVVWFLIGRTDDGLVRPYAFTSLERIDVTEELFTMDKDFPIEEYIATPPVTCNTGDYPDDSDMFYLERYKEQGSRRSRFRPAYRADQNNNLREAPMDDAVKQLIFEQQAKMWSYRENILLNGNDGQDSALPAEVFKVEMDIEYPVSQPYFIVHKFSQNDLISVRFSTEGEIMTVPYQIKNCITPEETPKMKERVIRWLNDKCSDPHFNGSNRELVEWHWRVRPLGLAFREDSPLGNLIVEE